MNDTPKKDERIRQERSPNSPTISLEGAIALVAELYGKIGRSRVVPLKVASALGYSGLSGASLTVLAALRSYGLIDREHGEDVSVSAAAIKLLHPVDKSQEEATKVELALKPKVFQELFTAGFSQTDLDVIANHLVQKGVIPERARKTAAAYCANYDFANLSRIGIFPVEGTDASKQKQEKRAHVDTGSDEAAGERVLAKYSIPLGANEAALVFTGEGELSAADFDDLIEFVNFAKKQWQRKTNSGSAGSLTPEEQGAEDDISNEDILKHAPKHLNPPSRSSP
jgi:hypothetical protein